MILPLATDRSSPSLELLATRAVENRFQWEKKEEEESLSCHGVRTDKFRHLGIERGRAESDQENFDWTCRHLEETRMNPPVKKGILWEKFTRHESPLEK
jgi:hypothetical protein